jgi:hypothetical protein
MAWGDGWVPRRANEPYQKKVILDRLLKLWLEKDQLRLGQLIGNVFHSTDQGGIREYYAEDWDFIELLEKHYGVEVKDDTASDGQGAVGNPDSGDGVHGSPEEPA